MVGTYSASIGLKNGSFLNGNNSFLNVNDSSLNPTLAQHLPNTCWTHTQFFPNTCPTLAQYLFSTCSNAPNLNFESQRFHLFAWRISLRRITGHGGLVAARPRSVRGEAYHYTFYVSFPSLCKNNDDRLVITIAKRNDIRNIKTNDDWLKAR